MLDSHSLSLSVSLLPSRLTLSVLPYSSSLLSPLLALSLTRTEPSLQQDGKVAVRNIRRESVDKIKAAEKDKDIGKDDSKGFQVQYRPVHPALTSTAAPPHVPPRITTTTTLSPSLPRPRTHLSQSIAVLRITPPLLPQPALILDYLTPLHRRTTCRRALMTTSRSWTPCWRPRRRTSSPSKQLDRMRQGRAGQEGEGDREDPVPTLPAVTNYWLAGPMSELHCSKKHRQGKYNTISLNGTTRVGTLDLRLEGRRIVFILINSSLWVQFEFGFQECHSSFYSFYVWFHTVIPLYVSSLLAGRLVMKCNLIFLLDSPDPTDMRSCRAFPSCVSQCCVYVVN